MHTAYKKRIFLSAAGAPLVNSNLEGLYRSCHPGSTRFLQQICTQVAQASVHLQSVICEASAVKVERQRKVNEDRLDAKSS